MFEAFPKLTRFSHDWVVTEKIDGSNAAIIIVEPGVAPPEAAEHIAFDLYPNDDYYLFAQFQNRLIKPGKADDHYGFAGFVRDNAEELVAALGEGRHFGEWYGKGIGKRGYNADAKRFALFNVRRWRDAELPDRVDVVPTLYEGRVGNFVLFDELLTDLQTNGSRIAPGFMDPEGIVMFHGPSKTLFKRTFDYDEAGKWAENQARKNV